MLPKELLLTFIPFLLRLNLTDLPLLLVARCLPCLIIQQHHYL
nr:MAG TPA: hypothetical protein [Bacteriophage sp.]